MLVGKFYHRYPNRNWTQKGWTYSWGSLLYIFHYFIRYGLTSSWNTLPIDYFPYIENSAWQRSLEDINKGNWITCLFIFFVCVLQAALSSCSLIDIESEASLCYVSIHYPSDEYPSIFLRQNGGYCLLLISLALSLAPLEGKMSRSRAVIGYPSQKDGDILPALRDYTLCPAREITTKVI